MRFSFSRHAAVVSHLHADHCCGLEDFGYYSFFAVNGQAKLLIHPNVSERLWNGLLAAGMELIHASSDTASLLRELGDYFDLIALNSSKPVVCGPFSVECRRMVHLALNRHICFAAVARVGV